MKSKRNILKLISKEREDNMKKRYMAALTAAFITTAVSPLAVHAGTVTSTGNCAKSAKVTVIGGKINDCDSIKDIMSQLGNGNWNDRWNNCTPETKPETQPETKPEEDASETSFAHQVVALVNAERKKAGLSEVTLDEKVEAAALVRAKETEQSFSHTRPNGSNFSTALKEQGVSYRGSGENIAWGQKTPEDVMKAWMNSEGHRANILNARFTKIGVGYYQNARGTNYWTQLFTY